MLGNRSIDEAATKSTGRMAQPPFQIETMQPPDEGTMSATRLGADIHPVCAGQVAQNAVFQIAEIFEIILDNLSFPDLEACKAVDRHFLHFIENSSLLRQRISLECVRTETLRYFPTSGGAFGFVMGPQITERRLCPLLSLNKGRPGSPADCFPAAAALFSIREYLDDEASWEKVYLTNPPVPEAWISVSWRVESDDFTGGYMECRRIQSHGGGGLTLGRLYRGLLEQRRWTAQCGATRRRVPWSSRNYVCARRDTVMESLARLEELAGVKPEPVEGRCCVYFPRMVSAVGRQG